MYSIQANCNLNSNLGEHNKYLKINNSIDVKGIKYF